VRSFVVLALLSTPHPSGFARHLPRSAEKGTRTPPSATAQRQGGCVTRFAAILLALSLAAGGALAASPEAAYLAARDRAIAEIKALEDSKAGESAIRAAEDKAAADLEKRLRDIVGPVAVKGFPPAGKLNLALSEHEEEFGDLDGLAFFSEGQDMVVASRPLLTAWLEQMAKDEDKERRLPTGVEAAVGQDNFYTFSVGEDAAFAKYADLPVTKPPGADLVVAALGVFQQADGPWPPDAIVATVIKGDRVFVASIRRKPPIGQIPACRALWTKAKHEQATEAPEQGDKAYRACFSAHAAKEPFFAGLIREAQSLVDRLAGR
jgi:hypothetical protein